MENEGRERKRGTSGRRWVSRKGGEQGWRCASVTGGLGVLARPEPARSFPMNLNKNGIPKEVESALEGGWRERGG